MKKILFALCIIGFGAPAFAQPSDPGPDNCLAFDGIDDYINLGDSTELLNLSQGDFTLEAWIRTSSFASQNIIGNVNGNPAYALWLNGGFLAFYCGNTSYTSSVPLFDNEWHHLAVVRDQGTNLFMYYDGLLVFSQGSDPSSPFSAVNETWIGRSPSNTQQFSGSIDEVRIWNSARTESQIREFSINVLEGNEANLVAYYRFDESTGSNLPDISANALDGTMYNMDDTDWIVSDPFNTWLGGTSSSWSTASNWSRGSVPAGENIGILNFPTGNDPEISGAINVNNVYIGSGVSLTISSAFTVNGNLLINNNLNLPSTASPIIFDSNVEVGAGALLNLSPGSQLTINGLLYNSGSLIVQSPANNGATGSFITNGGITNLGTMIAQRWISAGDTSAAAIDDFNWHSISIPTASSAAGDLFLYDRVLSSNEADNTWANLELVSDPISRGTGYLVKTPNDKTISFAGTFNTGTYGYTLNNTGADATHGYNFVGNPYPSSIDLELITRTNIGTTVWVWDPVGENYITHSIGGGASTLGQYIQPFQSFFLKVNSGSATGDLTFENADRVHNTSGTFYKKSAGTQFEELVLKVKGNDKYDILYIKDRNSVNDSYKFFSWNPKVPMIYAKEEGTNYAIYNLNGIYEDKRVQLGFYAGPVGNYSLEVLEESVSEYDLYLVDNKTGKSQLLKNGTVYDFNYESDIEEERFEILFSPRSGTGINEKDGQFFTVYAENMNINILKKESEFSSVKVYDLNGRLVESVNSDSDIIRIPVRNKGIYIVKIISGEKLETKKLGVF